MSLIQEIRNDISGAEILRDWLGDGDPVHPMVAEARAKRCTTGNDGKPCPHNIEPNWWDRIKHVAAEWIRSEIELKAKLKLHVPQEKDLAMCKICGCCLSLKVWTPIQHIKNHVTSDALNATPEYCWMRKEILG